MEGSNWRWRGAITGDGERLQAEGRPRESSPGELSNRKWRGVIAGGRERSEVKRS